MDAPNCPLCRKVAAWSELPAVETVWRFAHSVALLGPWQYFHGYCVLVARRHACELSGLSDIERRAYLDEMCLLARAIEETFHPLKLNYELLGNQVPHLHWHLFPRSADDPNRLQPVWLALDRAERDEAEAQRLKTGRLPRPETKARLIERLESFGISSEAS
jgi:diadenosine tetraphosphate (Ap4A) HIT family hydrolase